MASFPSSVASLSNPSSSDTLNSGTAALKHATQHSNANDEIEAIETYLLNNVQAVYKQETTTVNVASTSYTDAMTQTITTTGGDLLVWGVCGSYVFSGTPGDFTMSLRLDSGTDLDLAQRSNTGTGTMSVVRLFANPSSALHTVALRMKNAAAGTQQTFWRQLLIFEIRTPT
jgi:hypothetical protein